MTFRFNIVIWFRVERWRSKKRTKWFCSTYNCFPATGLYFKSKVLASVGRGSTETTRLQHGSSTGMFGDTHARGGGGGDLATSMATWLLLVRLYDYQAILSFLVNIFFQIESRERKNGALCRFAWAKLIILDSLVFSHFHNGIGVHADVAERSLPIKVFFRPLKACLHFLLISAETPCDRRILRIWPTYLVVLKIDGWRSAMSPPKRWLRRPWRWRCSPSIHLFFKIQATVGKNHGVGFHPPCYPLPRGGGDLD